LPAHRFSVKIQSSLKSNFLSVIKGGDIMEDIQRHTDCDNFQMPECPQYENVMMKEAYLIKEGVANDSSHLPDQVDNELCKDCDGFTPKT
jgi:uncharacterized protein YlaN (UPF0358 family)